MAVIKVGGATETEVHEKKFRVEDALSATRSAVEEGVVPGGGVAYIRVQGALERAADEMDNPEEAVGVRILQRAVESPLRRLVSNAGLEAAVIVDDVRNAAANTGYDVARSELGDMYELGILDPVKVARAALENAVSVAALMLTTESLVGDIREYMYQGPAASAGIPDMNQMAAMGGGMPGGGMPPGMPGM